MAYLAQQLVNGIHLGALYALLAFGYSLAHSVLKRASFAHGALFAFSGQLTILFAGLAWQTFWLVYPAALAVGCLAALAYTAGASWLVAAKVLAPMRNAAPNTVIAATLGVLLFLSELVRLAAGNRSPWLSPFLNTVLVLGGSPGFTVTTTPIKLISSVLSFTVIAAGSLLLSKSRAGLAWRAVSQDETAARLLGVDSHAVFMATMVSAGLLAGFAGVLAAWHYGNIDFATGMAFATKILFVASLGGLSTPAMAACGGLAVGIFETLWDGWFPSVWRDAATYSLLCAILVATRRSSPIGD